MPATLVIRDGDPHWWASPDIWVVPGIDPNGSPGQPVAGEPAYLWGRARNTGDQTVTGARVDFYWSNPATGVLRSNSTLVGSAFVDLNAGEVKDVLCVIPWTPVIVNEGHECVVAEIVHSADPLPAPPPDAFDPPTYRQIAQKNLSVLAMRRLSLVRTIQLAAPRREARSLRVSIEVGGSLDKEVLARAGLEGFRPAKGSIEAGLSTEAGCEPSGKAELAKDLEVVLKPGTTRAVYLKVPPARLESKTYVPIHVVSRNGDRIDGGITFVVVNREEE